MMDLFRLYCLLMVARVALVLMLVERVAFLMVYLVAALAAYLAWFGHDWYALRALHVVFVALCTEGGSILLVKLACWLCRRAHERGDY